MIERIDHVVLTVKDVEATCAFYSEYLGMRVVRAEGQPTALHFGNQKFNLHEAGKEFEPKAHTPLPGSADFCLIADTPLDEVVAHLSAQNIEIELGPVDRTGATGPIRSIYLRDPDGNLVEVANNAASTDTA